MIITNHHTDYELVALQEEVHMDGGRRNRNEIKQSNKSR